MKRTLAVLFLALIVLVSVASAVTLARTYIQNGPTPLTCIYPTAVPTSLTDVVTSDVRVVEITLTNNTSGAITVTVQDKQGSPQAFLSSISVPANSVYVIETPGLRFMPGGVSWQASDTGIVGYVSWR